MGTSVAKRTRFLFRVSVACCAMVFLVCATADARGVTRVNRANSKYAAVIMDAQSGKILQQSNADKVLFPASLTKMMTLFLTFEALDNNQLHINKFLTVSREAQNQPPSKLGIKPGEKITVHQAIQALVTRSANDVAFALAETVGGSHRNFTRMMTERAKSLGMTHSNFVNASGLPDSRQQSSARDMAILARALMQYFPHYYSYFNTTRFSYKGRVIETHNHLMKQFKGMDGLKTGYTNASGFNLAASAVKNNRRVIVVVFGGRSAKSRDQHVADLMNRGFAMLPREQQTTQVASATTQRTTITQQPARSPQGQQGDQQLAMQTTTVNDVISDTLGTPAPARNVQTATVTATPVSYQPQPTASNGIGTWGIQVGAFGEAHLGQSALAIVKRQLGGLLQDAKEVVVPTHTANGTMYRARLLGLTAENAAKACSQLTECLVFSVK
jgi:D-alanyl-D-alanine carboxypeptidase